MSSGNPSLQELGEHQKGSSTFQKVAKRTNER